MALEDARVPMAQAALAWAAWEVWSDSASASAWAWAWSYLSAAA